MIANRPLVLKTAMFLSVLLIIGCGGGDSDGPAGPEPGVPMDEALAGYWDAQTEVTDAMGDLDAIMDQIEATLTAGKSNTDVGALVEQYLAASVQAGERFDDLLELEDAIQPYGGQGKGMFTNAVKGVVRGVLITAKNAVVSSGQMLRTSWRVLSGSHSLREALSASDSGIPIVSDMAKRLEEHNAQRDIAIIDMITTGNEQDGLVPLGSLDGSTPAEKVASYRNLPDNHALKKRMRGDVHLWHQGELDATVVTLKKTAQDQIKNYVGATSGSSELAEVGDQLTSPQQDPAQQAPIAVSIRDIDTQGVVEVGKTVIIAKRDQPATEPRIAILQGVSDSFTTTLPVGAYDFIVVAKNYIRAVQDEVTVAEGIAAQVAAELYNYADNALVLESLTVAPGVVPVGGTVTARAMAATTVGGTLAFEWTVTGGAYADLSGDGPTCTFRPTEAGDYTVAVTVTGALGATREATAAVEVTPTYVRVGSFDLASEQFVDDAANPGETVTYNVTLVNEGDEDVNGNLAFVPIDRVAVLSGNWYGVTVPARGQIVQVLQVCVPQDYSEDTASVEMQFATAAVTVGQEMILDVAWFVEIDAISSPVTDRVLTISGVISSPTLTSAHLSIDGDADQVFELNVNNGRFSQDVAVEASNENEDHTVRVFAWAGSRLAEDTAGFSAQVPPAGFRVTLTWDTPETDVDLWTTDPSGERCYYGNDDTAMGLSLDFDDTNGFGPENITIGQPPVGDYLVQVHYYDDEVEDGPNPTGCTVVIRLNEGTPEQEVRTYYGSLGETGDVWTVTTITLGGNDKSAFAVGGVGDRVDPKTLPRK